MVNSLTDSLKQSLLYPKNLVQGHLQQPTLSTENVPMEEGAVVEENGHKVAIYKNENGEVTKLSPICTHMACVVGWNNNEKTWDCPCHGSRFDKTGKVINGPAEKDLNPA